MKTPTLLLAALLCLGVVAEAQTGSPTPSSQIAPAAPADQKPGFFQRFFKKKPTPTPVPTATPAPTPVRKKKVRRTSRPSPTPVPVPGVADSADTSATSAVTDSAAPAPNMGDSQLPASLPPLDQTASTPAVADENNSETAADAAAPAASTPEATSALPEPTAEVKANPFNQTIPIIGEAATTAASIQIPASNDLADEEQQAVDKIKFRKLKAQALEDSKLQKLKAGADSATTMGERYTGLKKFYPALFAKMRELDKSQSAMIDSMEAAAQRRLQRMLAESPGGKPSE